MTNFKYQCNKNCVYTEIKNLGVSTKVTYDEWYKVALVSGYLDSASEKVDYYREDIMLDDELILDGDNSEKN